MYSDAARPYGVSFAMAIASASVSNSMTDRTGPKISSRAIACRSDVVEDRRRDEPAAGLLEDPLAAGDDPGALAPADVDVAEDPLHVARG